MVQPDVIEQMNDEQLGQYAMEVLSRELGLAGFARYLRVYHAGAGDYTRDRHQWLAHLSLDDLMEKIRQRNQ